MTTLIAVVALVIYLAFYFTFGRNLRDKLLQSDKAPKAPSERLSDGVDYIPTNKFVLFGHHFAAITGAGPLVGPMLAAQFGYSPGIGGGRSAHAANELQAWKRKLFLQFREFELRLLLEQLKPALQLRA